MALHLSTIVLPLGDRAESMGEVVALRCAETCDEQPGLLAQRWAFNASTGAVGGLLRWADAAACERLRTAVLGRLAELIPSRATPTWRTYCLAPVAARSVCAPHPARRAAGWDHYEI